MADNVDVDMKAARRVSVGGHWAGLKVWRRGVRLTRYRELTTPLSLSTGPAPGSAQGEMIFTSSWKYFTPEFPRSAGLENSSPGPG